MMICIDFTFSPPERGIGLTEDIKSITFDGPSDEVQAKMRGFIGQGLWLVGVTIL